MAESRPPRLHTLARNGHPPKRQWSASGSSFRTATSACGSGAGESRAARTPERQSARESVIERGGWRRRLCHGSASSHACLSRHGLVRRPARTPFGRLASVPAPANEPGARAENGRASQHPSLWNRTAAITDVKLTKRQRRAELSASPLFCYPKYPGQLPRWSGFSLFGVARSRPSCNHDRVARFAGAARCGSGSSGRDSVVEP